MRIILLKESGRARGEATALSLTRTRLVGLALLCTTLLLAAAVSVNHWFHPAATDEALVAEWRQRLVEQKRELARLQARSTAEARAVGRQLAAMQARLVRMEALGARVTEVAELKGGEFSFDQPAPMGGPAGEAESPLAWTELQANLEDLAGTLRVRESELEVLESLLRDREYRQETVVAGRPVTWGWISSDFGKRVDPFSGRTAWHEGVDFAGRQGSDVIAVASGVVTHSGSRNGYGLMVEISHGDGYVTRYAHHEALTVVVGDIVKKGQVIGVMGSTGRSTGPHVHFEVLKNGRPVDPKAYVARK